jgi:hypothetical protein
MKKRPRGIGENTPSGGHQRTITSLSTARCQILRFAPELLRFSENRKLKTRSAVADCVSLTARAAVTRTGFLNKCRDPRDRRASARMVLIATSLLRSSLIVTPRHSSAPAKSKPSKVRRYSFILSGNGTVNERLKTDKHTIRGMMPHLVLMKSQPKLLSFPFVFCGPWQPQIQVCVREPFEKTRRIRL